MKPILLTLLLAIAAYYGWTHRAGIRTLQPAPN